MAINFPTIDLSKTYNVWYNGQAVTITTKDGYVWEEIKALRQPIKTDSVDLGKGQKMGQRTTCTWLLFKNLIPTGLMPQIGDRIEDSNGDYWLVNKIVNRYFGNITTLETESLAGLGVTNVQIPTGSTSTTPAPTPAGTCSLTIDGTNPLAWSWNQDDDITWSMCETCYEDGAENLGLTLSSQQRGCVTRTATGWHFDTLLLEKQQTSGVKFEVTSAISTLNITSDATLLTNGTILLLLNGNVYNPNFAGETINLTISNPTIGDMWQIYIMSNMNLAEGDITVDFIVS